MLCHRLRGTRGTSECGISSQGGSWARAALGLGHAGRRSCRLCSREMGVRFWLEKAEAEMSDLA